MNEILNFLGFYVFINQNKLGKINFPLRKMRKTEKNFEPTGNSVHTTEIIALGKALLARLYLKATVYTNLLSVHNLLFL